MAKTSKVSFIKYLQESKQELEKVSWPTRKEVILYSLAVIIITLLVAVYFGALDFVLNLGLRALLA